jgi:hypothetical protein
MADDGLNGATDGTNRPGRSGGDSGGGACLNPQTGKNPKKGGFQGGQTVRGYHGPQQLGDEEIGGEDNPNAAARSD